MEGGGDLSAIFHLPFAIYHLPFRLLRGSMRALTATLIVLTATTLVALQKDERHVYVTALDKDGTPIVGLKTEHFAIRESGRDRDVLRVEPLHTPMHVAVLVDTSIGEGTPDETFRSSVVAFVERLAAVNHVAVYSFGDRASRASGFTQDVAQLRSATNGMFGWAHQRSHLMDAIDLTTRDFETAESLRPVIIAITSESPEASGRSAGSVIKRLISQSIAFHAVSVAPGGSSRTVGATAGQGGTGDRVPESSRRLGGMVAAGEGDRERNQVLQQGTEATGGGRQRVTSVLALGPALGRVANELANSYKVTFSRPGSARMQDLQVGLLVDGVTLRATAAPFGTR
jgi:VWFA-related protein